MKTHPKVFGKTTLLRCERMTEMNKLNLPLYFEYCFNGENLVRLGDAKDEMVEFVVEWLRKEGIDVTIPTIRGR